MFSLWFILGSLGSVVYADHGFCPVDHGFNPIDHTGGQRPYHPAPPQYGISGELPKGCFVDQAAYIMRHGSRNPEPGSFQGWVDLHTKLQNSTYTATGSLAFLPSWALPLNDAVNQASYLSDTGAFEAFALGVDLRNRYGFNKGGDPMTVWSAAQQRVVDTAKYFLDGYVSAGNYNKTALEQIFILPDSVNYTFANSLTASAACPNYVNNDTFGSNFRTAFRPTITKRLNHFLNGLQLTDTDIGIMMDLCAYQTEITGKSPFCDVFEEDEWLRFEYALDLQYAYGSGPANNLAGTTAWPWVKTVTDLFLLGPNKAPPNSTFTPPALIMGFTHDNDLPPVIAALGLFNESSYSPLDPKHINPARKFRSSYIVTFGARIAIERMSCVNPPSLATPSVVHHIPGVTPPAPRTTQYVRIKVNDAVVPIPKCDSGPGGSCELKRFAEYVAERGDIVGDFVERCGLSGVKNATSKLDFFTNPPS